MRELDRLDLKILDILQREGRIPVTELAERVNLSATPAPTASSAWSARA